ncbi:MAG: M23 family metallopeptidase [Novosphingobium sp.]
MNWRDGRGSGADPTSTAIHASDFHRTRGWSALAGRRSGASSGPWLSPSWPPAIVIVLLLSIWSGHRIAALSAHGSPQRWAFAGRKAPASTPVPKAIAIPESNMPARVVVYLAAGESVEKLLARSGIRRADAAKAGSLIASAVFPEPIAAGTPVIFTAHPTGQGGTDRVLDHLSLRARIDLAVVVRRHGSELATFVEPIAIDATPLNLAGGVGPDFPASLRDAGVPVGTVAAVLKALASGVAPASRFPSADRFEIVVARQTAADGTIEFGDLLYAALWRGTAPLIELVRWGSERDLITIAKAGRIARLGASVLPVVGQLTSRYGPRFHPILGYTRMHAGVDVGAPWGAPIVAALPGTVSFAGWHGGHGNYIRIEHGSGLSTGYAHLSRIAVRPGDRVEARAVIGNVGSSGLSTGPHLHYEVFRDGKSIDPLLVGRDDRLAHEQPRLAAAVASLRSLVLVPGVNETAGGQALPRGYR